PGAPRSQDELSRPYDRPYVPGLFGVLAVASGSSRLAVLPAISRVFGSTRGFSLRGRFPLRNRRSEVRILSGALRKVQEIWAFSRFRVDARERSALIAPLARGQAPYESSDILWRRGSRRRG